MSWRNSTRSLCRARTLTRFSPNLVRSPLGHFETKKPCRARVLCSSLAPLAADARPKCVSLKPSLSSGPSHLLSLVCHTRTLQDCSDRALAEPRHGAQSTGSSDQRLPNLRTFVALRSDGRCPGWRPSRLPRALAAAMPDLMRSRIGSSLTTMLLLLSSSCHRV